MTSAICPSCIADTYLGEAMRPHFVTRKCSECGKRSRRAVTVDSLAAVIEPVLRQHYGVGEDQKEYSGPDDDRGVWVQQGEPLSDILETVTGQNFSFQDELVDAIVALDEYWPPDGGEPLWDEMLNYVKNRTYSDDVGEQWWLAAQELKHGRRFFSPRAHELFDDLFAGIGNLEAGVGR